MATRTPATPESKIRRMVDFTNQDLNPRGPGNRDLCVTLETEITISLNQEFGVGRSVRIVASGAAFTQRLMLIDVDPALLSVTGHTGFIDTGHRKSCRRFHNVQSMWIMTLDAVHFSFHHRVVIGQMELALSLQMALKAGLRIVARVGDELPSAAPGCDMETPGSVARLTSMQISRLRSWDLNLGVATHPKRTRNIGMTFEAGLIANETRARHVGRNNHRALNRPARSESETHH